MDKFPSDVKEHAILYISPSPNKHEKALARAVFRVTKLLELVDKPNESA
jgi:hypothetical protein